MLGAGCGWWTSEPAPEPVVWHPLYQTATWPWPHACNPKGATMAGCFLHVPDGSFLMGAQSTDPTAPGYDPEAGPLEGPPRQVTVSSFWLMLDEVDGEAFARCVAEGPCTAAQALHGAGANLDRPDRADHPANGISWEGADTYCRWLGGRLPTEAEWEWAARGADGRRWPWGDEPGCGRHAPQTGERRHDGVRTVETTCQNLSTVHRGEAVPLSAHGLRHMAGNVWEWTSDEAPDGRRVTRGGGWTDEDPRDLRATVRGLLPPDVNYDDQGFRCAVSDEGRLMVMGLDRTGKAP